ncbi:MAG: hypothetical protein ICV79_29375, partial [Flavisolibacter sp.]|nr:hypothetical protein [Flavisolibacter sp.]
MKEQPKSKAVVLWTGGKDCNLALYEAKTMGFEIAALISFSGKDVQFKAHPIEIMKAQSEALDIPHAVFEIKEPYKEGYEQAIQQVKDTYRIDTIVTGDIAEIHGSTNWITDRCRPSGINVFLPLWHIDREQILLRLFSLGFKIIFSCVKPPWFRSEWLGKALDESVIVELMELNVEKGLDICGEQGEYHTW